MFVRYFNITLICIYFRAWKAKIEAWLQENEEEGKQSEETKRRIPKNRSSQDDSGKSEFYLAILLYDVGYLLTFFVGFPTCSELDDQMFLIHETNFDMNELKPWWAPIHMRRSLTSRIRHPHDSV